MGRGRGGAAEKEEREKKEVIYTSRPGPGTCLKAARAKRAPRGTMKAEGRESCGELMSLCATERFRLFFVWYQRRPRLFDVSCSDLRPAVFA